jgi:transcription elongation GreA/GreB family factor
MKLPSKQALKDELVLGMEKLLEAAERTHRTSVEGVTHDDAKPENDKDTRALEQSYVARGQARRVEEIRSNLALVQSMPVHPFGEDAPIALGALVVVEERGKKQAFYLAASGGGMTLQDHVQVVTPQSGLGRALLGKHAGDDCDAHIAGRMRVLNVVQVT